MKETPSRAEIVFLLGELWESRCLNVRMSEFRMKVIIVLHVAQYSPMLLSMEEKLARKKQAAAWPGYHRQWW